MITPSFIGIAGGTASGKSTIAKKLYNYYGASNSIIIDQDSYYKENNLSFPDRKIINYDHPDSIDIELFYSNLIELKNNHSIMKPVYNFSTHARSRKLKAIKPKKLIIVEGTLLFHFKQLTKLMFLKVFMQTPNKIRFKRRLKRDIAERGRDEKSVKKQYKNTVYPMHKKFIEPSMNVADLIIPGTLNIESSLQKLTKFIDSFLLNKK
tara:strand:+ start:2606 stop:3229 length:624 start_codon:yes stop_codon:yes gene_type:complete